MPEACAGVLGEKANAAAARKLLITVRYSIGDKVSKTGRSRKFYLFSHGEPLHLEKPRGKRAGFTCSSKSSEHRNVAEQESTIAELKTTIAQQQDAFASKIAQQQIEALAAGLQKVNAAVQLNKPSPTQVADTR